MNDKFRDKKSYEHSFIEAAKRLDRLIDDARPQLNEANININDECNRSGFDQSGFDYYLWRYSFSKKLEDATFKKINQVTISYLEPILKSFEPYVEIDAVLERFQIGKESEYKQKYKNKISIEYLEQKGMAKVILDTMSDIERGSVSPQTGLKDK